MYVSGCHRVDAGRNVRGGALDDVPGATDLTDPWNDRSRLADLLDLHDGRLGIPLLDDAGVREVLRSARRIAVIGASNDPTRPSNGVLRDLRSVGYEIVPVNPNEAAVDGLDCYPDLPAAVAATGRFDIVDVFRRADQCAGHAREAVETGAGCLWLQLGIASREAGRIALDGGLKVVMDRCTIIEYRRMERLDGDATAVRPPGTDRHRALRPHGGHMAQIHLHAEDGDYASVVLLPGDPNRATRMAARFDGGLEGTRLVNANRGLLGYTGTLGGVPVSIQTTMMGTPTTTIVMEELINLGVTTFIRVGTCGGFGSLQTGDVVVALAAASLSGIGNVLGGGEPTAPTADIEVVHALAEASRAAGLTTHVGPIVTSDVFYDPHPGGVIRWGRRGYLAAEMESAAVFLLAMRERGKGRNVRAGTILTVSDVIRDPDDPETRMLGDEAWYRLPEDELIARIDLTIGASLTAAEALGRG